MFAHFLVLTPNNTQHARIHRFFDFRTSQACKNIFHLFKQLVESGAACNLLLDDFISSLFILSHYTSTLCSMKRQQALLHTKLNWRKQKELLVDNPKKYHHCWGCVSIFLFSSDVDRHTHTHINVPRCYMCFRFCWYDDTRGGDVHWIYIYFTGYKFNSILFSIFVPLQAVHL